MTLEEILAEIDMALDPPDGVIVPAIKHWVHAAHEGDSAKLRGAIQRNSPLSISAVTSLEGGMDTAMAFATGAFRSRESRGSYDAGKQRVWHPGVPAVRRRPTMTASEAGEVVACSGIDTTGVCQVLVVGRGPTTELLVVFGILALHVIGLLVLLVARPHQEDPELEAAAEELDREFPAALVRAPKPRRAGWL